MDNARVDLVFADVIMPRIHGLTVTRLIRNRFPARTVVLTTRRTLALDTALECAAATLIKPFTAERSYVVHRVRGTVAVTS